MSDTPRTDAVEYDTGLRTAEECAKGEDRGPDMVVPAHHASTLERELAAERAAREKAEHDLAIAISNADRAVEVTMAFKAKVARLREALALVYDNSRLYHPDVEKTNVGEVARAALKDTDG